MATPIPSSCRKFRAEIVPLFLCLFVLALPGSLCVVLVRYRFKVDLHALARAGVSVPVLCAVMAWLLSVFYSAGLSADGIYGHSFWGMRRFIHWREIADAKTFS